MKTGSMGENGVEGHQQLLPESWHGVAKGFGPADLLQSQLNSICNSMHSFFKPLVLQVAALGHTATQVESVAFGSSKMYTGLGYGTLAWKTLLWTLRMLFASDT